MELEQTRQLLLESCVLPRCVCAISLSYVQAVNRDCWESIAFAGEYETCAALCLNVNEHENTADDADAMHGACKGDHLEIVKLLVHLHSKPRTPSTGDCMARAKVDILNWLTS